MINYPLVFFFFSIRGVYYMFRINFYSAFISNKGLLGRRREGGGGRKTDLIYCNSASASRTRKLSKKSDFKMRSLNIYLMIHGIDILALQHNKGAQQSKLISSEPRSSRALNLIGYVDLEITCPPSPRFPPKITASLLPFPQSTHPHPHPLPSSLSLPQRHYHQDKPAP